MSEVIAMGIILFFYKYIRPNFFNALVNIYDYYCKQSERTPEPKHTKSKFPNFVRDFRTSSVSYVIFENIGRLYETRKN